MLTSSLWKYILTHLHLMSLWRYKVNQICLNLYFMGLGWKGKCRNKALCYWWNYGIVHWIFSDQWCGNSLFYFKGNFWDVSKQKEAFYWYSITLIITERSMIVLLNPYLINYLSIHLSIDLLYPQVCRVCHINSGVTIITCPASLH